MLKILTLKTMIKTTTVFILTLIGFSIFAQPFNNYLDLDGVDDYVKHNFSGSNMPNGDFTVEFWLKSCQSGGYKLIDAAGSTAGAGFEMNYSHNGGSISASVKGSYPTGGNVSSSITTDVWKHIAVTNNSSTMMMTLYIDGVWTDTSTVTGYNRSSRFYIGRMDYTTSGYLKINIDEMRISDIVRYNSNFTPPSSEFSADANTKALYHFNEVSGQTSFLDATTNGYNLIAMDGAQTISSSSAISATTPSISTSVTTICEGDSSELTINTGTLNDNNTWEWFSTSCNGASIGTGTSIYVKPTTNTTYFVKGTGGCAADGNCNSTFINVIPAFNVVASVSNNSICTGDSISLNATGATTYSWNNGGIHNSYIVPTNTTTYTVTGNTGNCTETDQITVTVKPNPTVTANTTNATICQGESTILTGSGASSYTWDNNVQDNSAFAPTSTQTYTVVGTATNGCTDSDNVTITVNQLPNINANTTSMTICQGENITLFGSGGTSYFWNNNVTDGTPFAPTQTTTYTVTGTNTNCTNTDEITVVVETTPTISINSSATEVCQGESLTLSGSGNATSYTWDNNVIDNTSFTPNATTLYTLTGQLGNCSDEDTITIIVNQLPTVNAVSNDTEICEGASTTLTATGNADSYSWDNNVVDGVSFTPTQTETYTVTGVNSNCSATDEITITVEDCSSTLENKSIKLEVYPNPAKEQVFIESNLLDYEVSLVDLTGQKITSKINSINNSTISLSLSELPKGVYFIIVNSNGEFYTKKIIKN